MEVIRVTLRIFPCSRRTSTNTTANRRINGKIWEFGVLEPSTYLSNPLEKILKEESINLSFMASFHRNASSFQHKIINSLISATHLLFQLYIYIKIHRIVNSRAVFVGRCWWIRRFYSNVALSLWVLSALYSTRGVRMIEMLPDSQLNINRIQHVAVFIDSIQISDNSSLGICKGLHLYAYHYTSRKDCEFFTVQLIVRVTDILLSGIMIISERIFRSNIFLLLWSMNLFPFWIRNEIYSALYILGL